jgi:hypothetical protein
VIRSLSGVRRSEYCGKNESTGSSMLLTQPRSIAIPSTKATTLFVNERSSRLAAGPKSTSPTARPQCSSLPEKYCSNTSAPLRTTSTAWMLPSFQPRSHVDIEQSVAPSRSTVSGSATGHPSSAGLGAPHPASACACCATTAISTEAVSAAKRTKSSHLHRPGPVAVIGPAALAVGPPLPTTGRYGPHSGGHCSPGTRALVG